MSNAVGRPPDLIREAWMLRFGIFMHNPARDIPDSVLKQLCGCASDRERRLILGVSEKYTEDERPTFTPALMVRYDETHE